jgi:hypothetical protein
MELCVSGYSISGNAGAYELVVMSIPEEFLQHWQSYKAVLVDFQKALHRVDCTRKQPPHHGAVSPVSAEVHFYQRNHQVVQLMNNEFDLMRKLSW